MKPLQTGETPPPTVAELIAQYLSGKGVRYVFGLPGGENVLLMDALRRAGIQFILVHHEASAGFAADVWGQLHGQPGVCLSTVGPGAVNLLAAAAGATLERSPVLAITAEVDPPLRHRITHMQLDLPALFDATTKKSISLTAEEASHQLAQAWEMACTPPFGAVHLSLAPYVAAQQPKEPAAPLHGASDRTPEAYAREAFEEARQLLSVSNRIMLVAGLGVEMSGARLALRRLAEAWNVPVTITPKAKGQFPESHPLFAGCFSAYADLAIREELENSDLILGVGLDGVDFVTSIWDIKTPLINLSPWAQPDPVTSPQLTLTGNLSATIEDLLSACSSHPDGLQRAAALRRRIREDLDTDWPAGGGYVRLDPLIAALRGFLPADGVVTLDVGVFKLVFLQSWTTDREKTLFVANGLSAMGYAIPGAMAVQLALPETPVMAIVGDGALHMYLGELATISRLGLPLTVLVVVDHSLALIRLKQLRSDLPVFGTEFEATDYASLAQAFGMDYGSLDDENTMAATLRKIGRGSRPRLIEARVHLDEYSHFK